MKNYKQMELSLTLSQEDSHDRTSHLQEKGKELSENDHLFGRSMQGSSTMYGRNGRLLKMYHPFDLGDLPWSYKISARSGTMQNGIAYPLPQLVRLTEGIASGSSPTQEKKEPTWPTPNAWDGKRGPRSQENLRQKKHQVNLITAVKDAESEKPVMTWPTPRARDWKDSMKAVPKAVIEGKRKHTLGTKVAEARLLEEKQSKPSPPVSNSTGQLSPMWVEWLMGYPIGYTDLNS